MIDHLLDIFTVIKMQYLHLCCGCVHVCSDSIFSKRLVERNNILLYSYVAYI